MPLVSYPEIQRESCLPVFVTGIGVEYAQASAARPTLTHPQLLMTLKGRGQITVREQTVELPAGHVFYLNRNVDYQCRPDAGSDEVWTVDWITFGFGGEALCGALFTDADFAVIKPADFAAVHKSIRKIYDCVSLDGRYGGFSASAILYDLLIQFHREFLGIPERVRRNESVIHAVIAYINEHYQQDIALDELCTAAGGLSEQYLCRLFKQSTGLRPVEYILKKRIGIAQSYLEKTDLSIAEIAEATGFHNTSYFYRNFKKFTGTSPLTYRQNALGDGGTDGKKR